MINVSKPCGLIENPGYLKKCTLLKNPEIINSETVINENNFNKVDILDQFFSKETNIIMAAKYGMFIKNIAEKSVAGTSDIKKAKEIPPIEKKAKTKKTNLLRLISLMKTRRILIIYRIIITIKDIKPERTKLVFIIGIMLNSPPKSLIKKMVFKFITSQLPIVKCIFGKKSSKPKNCVLIKSIDIIIVEKSQIYCFFS